jgi:hypothetical protein
MISWDYSSEDSLKIDELDLFLGLILIIDLRDLLRIGLAYTIKFSCLKILLSSSSLDSSYSSIS